VVKRGVERILRRHAFDFNGQHGNGWLFLMGLWKYRFINVA
jgi:hypothetical protein